QSSWGGNGDAGRPTREKTSGARQDWLVTVASFWNWCKSELMRRSSIPDYVASTDLCTTSYLGRKLLEAYVIQRRTTRYFASMTAGAGPMKVASRSGFRSKIVSIIYAVLCTPSSSHHVAVLSMEKALQDLIYTNRAKGGTHVNDVVSRMHSAAVLFIKPAWTSI
ncbi:hypothetical protein C8T65DRAFT_585839, partial [Cerioporus squamosus]